MSNLMKICVVEAELFRAEGRVGGRADGHDEANSRTLRFFKRA
jgi:hypothetical protein